METSLHRQLKEVYADAGADLEVPLGRYRIDVVTNGELVEIQHGSLAAIRDKIAVLVKKNRVLVVKPIISQKQLIKLDRKGGREVSRRKSPKRGDILDIFDELVYFTRVFPNENLSLEVPLVTVEEIRFPGHGRRRRRRDNDFQIQDQKLIEIIRVHRFRTANDLLSVLGNKPKCPFHTGDLAASLGVERRIAQRIAYCLREMGAVIQVGKQRNAILYDYPGAAKAVA